ncbi:DUF2179 domain-containing protein [Cohnella caldifontis]|uniref:DUF2179 domain-containing protein n=1 Tax=Cohnella caldifontis TaxID=3027471 RepID=UPI0023EE0D61|nr:DUF2179 domain-containing protein [Cohnella sp. YIM B05605]
MSVLLSIVILQITYVTMLSVRFILMVKGFRYVAALMSAVEIGIYVVGFKLVLDNLDNPLNLVIYCLSYGAGVLLGVKIEERLALGYITVQVITKEERGELAAVLRSKGYGVTRWAGEGKEGLRWVHTVVLPRKRQPQLFQDVLAEDPNAFIVSYEPKVFHGGFLARRT